MTKNQIARIKVMMKEYERNGGDMNAVCAGIGNCVTCPLSNAMRHRFDDKFVSDIACGDILLEAMEEISMDDRLNAFLDGVVKCSK